MTRWTEQMKRAVNNFKDEMFPDRRYVGTRDGLRVFVTGCLLDDMDYRTDGRDLVVSARFWELQRRAVA